MEELRVVCKTHQVFLTAKKLQTSLFRYYHLLHTYRLILHALSDEILFGKLGEGND